MQTIYGDLILIKAYGGLIKLLGVSSVDFFKTERLRMENKKWEQPLSLWTVNLLERDCVV